MTTQSSNDELLKPKICDYIQLIANLEKDVKILEGKIRTLVKYIKDLITTIKDKNKKIIEQERIINGYRSANAALARLLEDTVKVLE